MEDRKQWFIDRIGKRVFNTLACDCNFCKAWYEAGIVNSDEQEAISCFYHERDFQAEGTKLKYFDTKEERTAYEIENNLVKIIE